MNVKIKKLVENAVIPKYAKQGDAGFDLVTIHDVIVAPGTTELVETGIAIELPPGYELQVRPRSGLSLNTSLRVANAPGTIDSGYRDGIGVIIDNIAPLTYRQTLGGELTVSESTTMYDVNGNSVQLSTVFAYPVGAVFIPAGTRIAQGVIAAHETATFTVVDELVESERGKTGFGSSGTHIQNSYEQTGGNE